MKTSKLTIPKILKYLSEVEDVYIISSSLPDELVLHDILGIKSEVHDVHKITNPQGFQPHESIIPKRFGVAFAIDILTPKTKQSKEKIKWVNEWRALGAIYIGAEDIEDLDAIFK